MTEIRESIAGFTEIDDTGFDSTATVTITPDGEAQAKRTSIQNIIANTTLDAFIKGSTTVFTTSASYAPIPMFTSGAAADFYTSAPGSILKAPDNTGLVMNVPVRYSVLAAASFEASVNDDYEFAILVDGVAVDLVQPIMRAGNGLGKFAAFTVDAYTGVLTSGQTIQLGVKNAGDTIATINASINVSFAGLN